MFINLPQIRRMADLIATTEDRDEEAGFLDTLEGETDAMEVADYLIREALKADAMAEASKALEKAQAARTKRFENRARATRRAMLDLMDATGLKKLERPAATISRRAGSLRVEIEDGADVPSQLCTVKTTTAPDKAAIKAQIEAGVEVPGCSLVRGDDSVTVRVA